MVRYDGHEARGELGYIRKNGSINNTGVRVVFHKGAQFTFDTIVTTKTPYADYLKDEV